MHSYNTCFCSTFFIHNSRGFSKSNIDKDLFRNVLLNIGDKLGIKEKEQWYKIRVADVKEKGGSPVLHQYRDSLATALFDLFPEYKLKLWKFEKVPVGYWSSKENQREFMNDFFKEKNLKNFEEWYLVSSEDIEKHKGRSLLKKYSTVPEILMNVYPDYDWKPWKFVPPIKGYWNEQANQRKFFNDLGNKLGIKHWTEWYNLSANSILENGGSSLLVYFKYSVAKAITSAFPEYEWDRTKFEEAYQNQRKFFDSLAKKYNIQKFEDWYSFKLNDFKNEFRNITSQYDNSFQKILPIVYPEFDWKPWKFARVWHGFWDSKSNQRAFLDDVFKTLKLEKWTDWYSVRQDQIEKLGGYSLFDKNNWSISSALMSNYPEYKWEVWRFETAPKRYWENIDKVREAIEWAGEQLGIKQIDDWYQITLEQLENLGLSSLVRNYNGIIPLLSRVYPLHKWISKLELPQFGKTQNMLLSLLKQLFPKTDVHFEYPHPDMVFAETQKNMQLDIFIPAYSLAIEYQGKQHFENDHMFSHGTLKTRDSQKREMCKKKGITLLGIPYWWNGDRGSIVSTILNSRPDLKQFMSLEENEQVDSPPLNTFKLMEASHIK